MSNIVWTNHALERNKDRQITQSWIEQTINNPESYSELGGNKTESKKRFGHQTVTVVTAKTDSGQYLILSAWINPPNVGTNDFKKQSYNQQMKKASNLKKLFITFKSQLGF